MEQLPFLLPPVYYFNGKSAALQYIFRLYNEFCRKCVTKVMDEYKDLTKWQGCGKVISTLRDRAKDFLRGTVKQKLKGARK